MSDHISCRLLAPVRLSPLERLYFFAKGSRNVAVNVCVLAISFNFDLR